MNIRNNQKLEDKYLLISERKLKETSPPPSTVKNNTVMLPVVLSLYFSDHAEDILQHLDTVQVRTEENQSLSKYYWYNFLLNLGRHLLRTQIYLEFSE